MGTKIGFYYQHSYVEEYRTVLEQISICKISFVTTNLESCCYN